MNIISVIARELSLKDYQVEKVTSLLTEGSTIPFIARYRKEQTGGLDEDVLREIEDRSIYLNMLQERKETILSSIEEQGKLTDELKNQINSCLKLQELEDLYLPYKPKRKTRGTIAKAKGLEPLAQFILDNPNFKGNFDEIVESYINSELGVFTNEDALDGASDIIAEMISDSAAVRAVLRDFLNNDTSLKSEKNLKEKENANLKIKAKSDKDVYQIYYDFNIEINRLKPYQLLALDRGEKEGILKVSFVFDHEIAHSLVKNAYFNYKNSAFNELLDKTVEDSFKRLLFPSLEREVRNLLTESAGLHAIEVFAGNLKNILLQPPLSGYRIMGLDPGYASGTKIAVIDETGKYLDGATIYPHPPFSKTVESRKILSKFLDKYDVSVIAIGNGTASRETELFVAETIKENNLDCKYVIVNEAGASVYSASEVAKKEFPDLEASQRGNISIARRLLDPLAELVKIDPKSIGVGLYQHDVDQKLLMKKLDDVVMSCVNYVGVDLNTSSASLLAYVSGLNKNIATKIIKHREDSGAFKSREDLLKVKGIGEKAYEQCAGFLKIRNGSNPLDNTFIHPESYSAVNELMKMLNIEAAQISSHFTLSENTIKKIGVSKVAEKIGLGEPTLIDIIENLKKPGRDPREELPLPILKSDVLNIEDLKPGMQLKGTVRNVVDFGAFVDIGVKQDGLIHISQMKKSFVKNAQDVLNAGDVVSVTIISVEPERKRISLKLAD
ncbi:MAG: RNA-binding transcriptional accessory protein [Ignavibacteriaceae bacterium]|nr:RNA-binding transcriptional accessory protein [Ignavibacteriaceae bacterium]